MHIYDDQIVKSRWVDVRRSGSALDDAFADTLAEALRRFIEVITPRIDDFENEGNEEGA